MRLSFSRLALEDAHDDSDLIEAKEAKEAKEAARLARKERVRRMRKAQADDEIARKEAAEKAMEKAEDALEKARAVTSQLTAMAAASLLFLPQLCLEIDFVRGGRRPHWRRKL